MRTRRAWEVEVDGATVWLAFSRSGLSYAVGYSEVAALGRAGDNAARGLTYPSHEAALELAVQYARAKAAARCLGAA